VADDRLGGQLDERELLSGFLDWYRGVAEHKVDGLSRAQASEPLTPSGLSVLGVIRHLAWVERLWFRWYFAGEDVPPRRGDDNSASFALEADDTVPSVRAAYLAETQRARAITGRASLDDRSAREHDVYGSVSLRWVLVHMLEETARHAGHLDLMRERLDGRTGD
jgi:Protein of unknown function (DUF664)